MNLNLLRLIYRHVIRKAALSGLAGRNRDRAQPEKGRFTHADIHNLLAEVWKKFDLLALNVPKQTAFGNQMNLYLSCITLCCFQTFLELGVEYSYAIELTGDVSWKVYEKWGAIPIIFTRFRYQNPRERMRFSVNAFLKFPFGPPGYLLQRLPSDEGISFDIQRCIVAEYFRAQGAAQLCMGTWCDLDFALAEMWGGWLERTETIAGGFSRCDFRFKAPAAK